MVTVVVDSDIGVPPVEGSSAKDPPYDVVAATVGVQALVTAVNHHHASAIQADDSCRLQSSGSTLQDVYSADETGILWGAEFKHQWNNETGEDQQLRATDHSDHEDRTRGVTVMASLSGTGDSTHVVLVCGNTHLLQATDTCFNRLFFKN